MYCTKPVSACVRGGTSVQPGHHAPKTGGAVHRLKGRTLTLETRIQATSRDDEDPSMEEILEECDEIEAEIDVADFEDVSVALQHEEPEDDDMMIWAGYMQRDLEPQTSGSTEMNDLDPTEMAIFRDNISGISSNPAVKESSAARFFDGNSLPLKPVRGSLSAWDLRASMETKRWFERDHQQWRKVTNETVGRYPSVASDWRTDVRIQESGDPAEVDYREWSMREIWDLITQNGEAADPRNIPFEVRKPGSRTNFVAEGYMHQPSIPQWLDAQGKLMKEEDANDVADDEAEGALLTSEFSDFDTDFDFSNDDV